MSRVNLCLCSLGVLLCAAVDLKSPTLNVTQDVYQAEEHSNITLTWMYPVHTNARPHVLIDIMRVNPLRRIYFYNSQREEELYPHEDFRGRLRCDAQLARRGRIHCDLTHLKLNDSGTYQCIVVVDQHSSYRSCDLKVTAAASHVPEEERPDPERRERFGLYAGSVFFAVMCAGLGLYCFLRNMSTSNT